MYIFLTVVLLCRWLPLSLGFGSSIIWLCSGARFRFFLFRVDINCNGDIKISISMMSTELKVQQKLSDLLSKPPSKLRSQLVTHYYTYPYTLITECYPPFQTMLVSPKSEKQKNKTICTYCHLNKRPDSSPTRQSPALHQGN